MNIDNSSYQSFGRPQAKAVDVTDLRLALGECYLDRTSVQGAPLSHRWPSGYHVLCSLYTLYNFAWDTSNGFAISP